MSDTIKSKRSSEVGKRRLPSIGKLSAVTIVTAALFVPALVFYKESIFLNAFPSSIKILFSFFTIFLGAGALLERSFFRGMSTDSIEQVAYWFGLNLPVLLFIGVITLELHRNVAWALNALFTIQLVLYILALASLLKPVVLCQDPHEAGEDNKIKPWDRFFFAIFIGALIFLSYLYYHVGGFLPGGDIPTAEEMLHLGMMRKLLENPTITLDNFYYRAHAYTPYLYAPFHLAMAMVARLSHFDVISIFAKFRVFSVFVSLCIFSSLSQALFKNRLLQVVISLLAVVLSFTQLGGDEPLHYWGQFAPSAYPTDFSAGMVMPVISLFLIKFLNPVEKRLKAYFFLLPILVVSAAAIHVREAFYILVYCVFLVLGFAWLADRDQKRIPIFRCVSVLMLTGLLAFIYLLRQHHVSSLGFKESEMFRRIVNLRETRAYLKEPWFGAFSAEQVQQFVSQVPLLFGGWFAFAFFLLPFVTLLRRSIGAVVLFSIPFYFLIFFRIPALKLLISAATFSEMFMIPVRMVSIWCYLVVGLFVYGSVILAERRPKTLIFLGPLFLVFPKIVNWLSRVSNLHPDLLIIWVILGSIILWRLSMDRRGQRLAVIDLPSFQHPGKGLCVLLGLLGLLVLGSTKKNLYDRYRESQTKPDVLQGEIWYKQTSLQQDFPYELISFIRQNIPIHSVFAYDFHYTYTLPMLANQYVISAGYIIQEEAQYVRDYLKLKRDTSLEFKPADKLTEKIRKYNALFDRHMKITANEKPIFNPNDSLNDIERYAKGMHIDYILVHPEHFNRLASLLSQNPAVFKKVYDRNSFAIFQVTPSP